MEAEEGDRKELAQLSSTSRTRYPSTIYDAMYLELAIRMQLPLATLDRTLADAGRAAELKVPTATSQRGLGSAWHGQRVPHLRAGGRRVRVQHQSD